jgi:cytochrome c
VFRQCAACHNVVNDAGEVLAGRPNMRTGPNLYGVAGETFGDIEGFRWSPGLQALNAAGVMITEETFTAYIQDPTGFIQEATGTAAFAAQWRPSVCAAIPTRRISTPIWPLLAE